VKLQSLLFLKHDALAELNFSNDIATARIDHDFLERKNGNVFLKVCSRKGEENGRDRWPTFAGRKCISRRNSRKHPKIVASREFITSRIRGRIDPSGKHAHIQPRVSFWIQLCYRRDAPNCNIPMRWDILGCRRAIKKMVMYSRKCNRECFSLPLSFSLSTHVRRIKLGHRAKEKLLLRMGLARPPRKGRRRSESSRRRTGRLRTGRNEGSSCTYFDTFPAAVALVGFRFKELRDVGGCYTPRRITSAFRFLSLHRNTLGTLQNCCTYMHSATYATWLRFARFDVLWWIAADERRGTFAQILWVFWKFPDLSDIFAQNSR